MVEQHARAGADFWADINMTSKICMFCFVQTRLMYATVLGKSVKVKGTVECVNPSVIPSKLDTSNVRGIQMPMSIMHFRDSTY